MPTAPNSGEAIINNGQQIPVSSTNHAKFVIIPQQTFTATTQMPQGYMQQLNGVVPQSEEDLINLEPIAFVHSVPVFSSLLRPSQLEGNSSLKYASVNENFQMISSLVTKINKDKLRMNQKVKEKASLMYDLQSQINEVYNELSEILARKKGDIRSALGGRLAFTSRSVIAQDPYLRCDEIKLPL